MQEFINKMNQITVLSEENSKGIVSNQQYIAKLYKLAEELL